MLYSDAHKTHKCTVCVCKVKESSVKPDGMYPYHYAL